MRCTSKERETCMVEKMGCDGCFYKGNCDDSTEIKKELKKDEQEIGKYTKNKIDKTN